MEEMYRTQMPLLQAKCKHEHNSGNIKDIIAKIKLELCIVAKNIVHKFKMIHLTGIYVIEREPEDFAFSSKSRGVIPEWQNQT